MPISYTLATDIASLSLDAHMRGPVMAQTIQDKPLLAALTKGQKTFPGGKQYITEPVQGAYMSDTAGFFAGYSGIDVLTFAGASNALRAQYAWKECHAGFIITHTELKQGGIVVTDSENKTKNVGEQELIQLTALLENRLNDFGESWVRSKNNMLWADGTQDTKQVPGLQSLITDGSTGTVGGLSQSTYTWWKNRAKLDLVASAENQTISKFFRNEVKQLRRYGGKPNLILCGSAFWDALAQEIERKGNYTQTGFAGGKTDIGLDTISLKGVGDFQYDPTMDDNGQSKLCYFLDTNKIKYRPMEGCDDKTSMPSRPYDYFVMLKSMSLTAALQVTQLNANGKYGIA